MPRQDPPESGGESRSERFARLRRRRRHQHLALALTTLVGVGALLADRHGGVDRAAAPVSARGQAPAASPSMSATRDGHAAGGDSEAASAIPAATATTGTGASSTADSALPISAEMARQVPAGTRQVVVVAGTGVDSSTARVTFYEADRDSGWSTLASWPGHVGRSGWSRKHVEGDLRTPIGVYRLSDAGGRLPAPAARLPYHRSGLFRAPEAGPGFGDSAADAFDHVIAIDYNRVAGRSPLDRERPLGAGRGGGIWLHLDHNGPTHGCVSVPKAGLQLLLRRLDPALQPVVVMGPRDVVTG